MVESITIIKIKASYEDDERDNRDDLLLSSFIFSHNFESVARFLTHHRSKVPFLS